MTKFVSNTHTQTDRPTNPIAPAGPINHPMFFHLGTDGAGAGILGYMYERRLVLYVGGYAGGAKNRFVLVDQMKETRMGGK
jgi:hypothetical protein